MKCSLLPWFGLALLASLSSCQDDSDSSGTSSSTSSNTGGTGGSGGATSSGGSGGTTTSSSGCTTAEQCPLPPNECVTTTCKAGQCGTGFVVSLTPTSQQTPHDCLVNACDGNGNVQAFPDDSDLPDDGNPCTKELCTGGVPSHPFESAGATCGGGQACDGAGHCTGCMQASDCPGQDTACSTRTCVASVCGTSLAPAGTLAGPQTPGDCHRSECDGNGNLVAMVDSSDVKVDGKECTDDVCVGGTPSNPTHTAGTPCTQNNGIQCDGNGTCVVCLTSADCGLTTACQVHTCIAGACITSNLPAGTLATDPMAGDCHADVCDGSGGITSHAAYDADVPADDGHACTGETCTSGTPGHPFLPPSTPCTENGGVSCDGAGNCVGTSGPTITATAPANGSHALASTSVSVTFSQAMNPATLTGQAVAGACTGSVQVSLDAFATCVAFSTTAAAMTAGDTVATFTATPGLLVNRTYQVRVTTEAQNASNLPLAAPFTTTSGFTTTSPTRLDGSLVIAEVYGGGGGATATYKNDYVVLHNRGATTVNVSTMSVQYGPATGTSWQVTSLASAVNPNLPPGGYFLVQLGGGSAGMALPAPDVTGTTNVAAASGKLALVNGTSAMAAGTCPDATRVIDFVGYGTANCSEGSAAPILSQTTAGVRSLNGCVDANANNTDMSAVLPNPQNSAATAYVCAPAQNESNTALEADYCATQYPLSLSVQTGASQTIYGRLYKAGLTGQGSANANVVAQLGYGPTTMNPQYEDGWTWIDGTYNLLCSGCGSNDEYQVSFTVPAAGTYSYVFRVSLDKGMSFTYCDNNQGDSGAGSGPNLAFDLADQGTLVSTP